MNNETHRDAMNYSPNTSERKKAMNQVQLKVNVELEHLDHLAVETTIATDYNTTMARAFVIFRNESGAEVSFSTLRIQDLDVVIKKFMEARVQLEINQKRFSGER